MACSDRFVGNRNSSDLREMEMFRRIMVEEHRKAATLAERKRILLEQLHLRFDSVPLEIKQAIEAAEDANQFVKWLRGVVTAKDLDGIGIVPPS